MTTGARRTLGAILGGLALALLPVACERAAVPKTAEPQATPAPAQPAEPPPAEPQATCADLAIRLLEHGPGIHGAVVADTLHLGGATAPVTCSEPANQSAAVLSLADGAAAQVQQSQSQYYLIVIRYPDGNRLYVISLRSDGASCIVDTNDECVAEVSDLPDDFDLSDLPDDVASALPAGREAPPTPPAAPPPGGGYTPPVVAPPTPPAPEAPEEPAAPDGAPPEPYDPRPRNGATGVTDRGPSLSWSGARHGMAEPTSFDLYWGTTQNLAADAALGTPITTSYTPMRIWRRGHPAPWPERWLEGETTYYWRVDAKNDAGTTQGPVWRFTTGPATPVKPTPPATPPPTGGDVTRESIIDFFSGTWAGIRYDDGKPNPDRNHFMADGPWAHRVVFDSSDITAFYRVVWSVERQSRTLPYGNYSPSSSRTEMVGPLEKPRTQVHLEWTAKVHALIHAGKSAADVDCSDGWAASLRLSGSYARWDHEYPAYLKPLHCLMTLAEEEQPVAPAWPQATQSISWVVGDKSFGTHNLAAPTGKPAPLVTLTGGTLPAASLTLDRLGLRGNRGDGRSAPSRRGSGTFTLTATNSAGTSDTIVAWEGSCQHSDATIKSWLQGSVWVPVYWRQTRPWGHVLDTSVWFRRVVINDDGITFTHRETGATEKRSYARPDWCRGLEGDDWDIQWGDTSPNQPLSTDLKDTAFSLWFRDGMGDPILSRSRSLRYSGRIEP